MKERAQNIMTLIIVLCAVTVTALFVRREMFSPSPTLTRLDQRSSIPVDNWRDFIVPDRWQGTRSPSVVAIEFIDYECPFCLQAEQRLTDLLDRYPTRLALSYRHFPLSIHANAFGAAIASECAAKQDRFGAFHRTLFANQKSIGDPAWSELAQLANIPDVSAFLVCLGDETLENNVLSDISLAESIGVTGTPAIMFNGRLFNGLSGVDSLEALLADGEVTYDSDLDPPTSHGSMSPLVTGPSLDFVEAGQIQHEFGRISTIAVGSTNHVFVGDDQAAIVWVFDSEHGLLHAIGGPGEGPGEFRDVNSLQVLADTLYVFDATLGRLTAFDTSREPPEVLRTITFRTERPVQQVLVESGDFMVVKVKSATGVVGAEIPRDSLTVHRLFTESVITNLGNTIFTIPRDQDLVLSVPGFVMVRPMPFGRRSFLRLGTNGTLWSLWTGRRIVHGYSSTGDQLFELALPGTGERRIAQEDLVTIVAAVEERDGSNAAQFLSTAVDQARTEDRFPATWPVATNLIVDELDRLWVTLLSDDDEIDAATESGYVYRNPSGDGLRIMRLDPGRRSVRLGRLPVSGSVNAATADKIYMVTENSLGIQSVVVFSFSD